MLSKKERMLIRRNANLFKRILLSTVYTLVFVFYLGYQVSSGFNSNILIVLMIAGFLVQLVNDRVFPDKEPKEVEDQFIKDLTYAKQLNNAQFRSAERDSKAAHYYKGYYEAYDKVIDRVKRDNDN